MVRWSVFLPLLLCVAVTVEAQTPPQDKPAGNPPATQTPTAQPPAPRPAQEPGMSANRVTYTGCVKPGATPGSWVLENAEIAPPAGQTAQAKPGPSGVGTAGAGKLSFNLKAADDLKAHANHKIEVVGTVAPEKAGESTAAKTPRDFNVSSIKMVSATCP
jgi:hypothetical protein